MGLTDSGSTHAFWHLLYMLEHESESRAHKKAPFPAEFEVRSCTCSFLAQSIEEYGLSIDDSINPL